MTRLRVVSWNVGRVYSPRHNNRLDDHDIPRVAETLATLAPDVILLQELVDVVQLRALGVRLGGGYDGALAERCAYDRHCAVLTRRALGAVYEQHELAPSGRGVVVAALALGARRAAFMPVHFDVFAGARRRGQAEALVALAEARAESLVIAAGDFNFDPGWAARIGDAVDRDTWAILTSHFLDGGPNIGPTLLGLLRLDHLLVRGAPAHALAARVVAGRRLPLGDHDPVLCDIDLTALDDNRALHHAAR